MFYTLFLANCLFFCVVGAQELSFDDEGNVISDLHTPFNFHKLVASKVKGEETTTTRSEATKVSPTEDAKTELRMLKGLYRELLETKDAGAKERLRSEIMEKVEKIEAILHKKKNVVVTEEAIDYFSEDKDVEAEVAPPLEKKVTELGGARSKEGLVTSTTFQPLFEFDEDDKVTTTRSKPDRKMEEAASTTTEKLAEVDLEQTYYPWESPRCQDQDKDACENFKPLCPLLGVIAYR